nr:hypothetical protein [Natrinema soli]
MVSRRHLVLVDFFRQTNRADHGSILSLIPKIGIVLFHFKFFVLRMDEEDVLTETEIYLVLFESREIRNDEVIVATVQ